MKGAPLLRRPAERKHHENVAARRRIKMPPDTRSNEHPSNERPPGRQAPDNRSFGQLLSELTRETRTLVRQEIRLAQTEVSEKASEAGKDVAYVAAGGAVAYVGLIAIVFAFAFLLAEVIPLWLSTLIVGLVVAGLGFLFISWGLAALKRMNLSLTRTTETLKEDKQWMKREMKGRETNPANPGRRPETR